jgi:hypothetical protein
LNTDISSAISTEASRRASADTVLQSNIDNEASIRSSADVVLQSNINTEASIRASADASIVSIVDNKYTKRTGIEIETDGIKLNSASGGYIYFGASNNWRLYGTNGDNGATPEIRFEYNADPVGNPSAWTKAVWLA